LDPADSAPIVGAGGGGGGGGDKCNRGGVKLGSNAGARVNVDVEDGEEGEEETDIDDMFDQIAEESQVNDDESGPALPLSLSTHPIPEKQALSTSTIHLLSTLAGSCRAVTSSESTATVFNNASNVLKSLVSGHSYDSVQPAFHDNTLLAIAHRCDLAERLVESSQFIFTLNLIQFRTKIEW
jgi:hypothetical protein